MRPLTQAVRRMISSFSIVAIYLVRLNHADEVPTGWAVCPEKPGK
jgi:hypothetical protein